MPKVKPLSPKEQSWAPTPERWNLQLTAPRILEQWGGLGWTPQNRLQLICSTHHFLLPRSALVNPVGLGLSLPTLDHLAPVLVVLLAHSVWCCQIQADVCSNKLTGVLVWVPRGPDAEVKLSIEEDFGGKDAFRIIAWKREEGRQDFQREKLGVESPQ